MEWREIVEHPSLKDLPFKIETNRWGEIVMTPGTVRHGEYQGLIIEWLVTLKTSGRIFVESGVQTSDGIRVADVAWGSAEFAGRNREEVLFLPESPEIVIEIKSPSNTMEEMERKKKLYFEKGAREVWFCDKQGDMHFFNASGELERSELFEGFPGHVDIEVV